MLRIIVLCLFVVLYIAVPGRTEEADTAPPVEEETQENWLDTVFLQRVWEPNEYAFSIQVPKGWQMSGGIISIEKMQIFGGAQALEPKLDFMLKMDEVGSVMLHWLPDTLYLDSSMNALGRLGYYRPGSYYLGMQIRPVMSATEYLKQIVIPQEHPAAVDMEVVVASRLYGLVSQYQELVEPFKVSSDIKCDAGMLTVMYEEDGILYKERLITAIQDLGASGDGVWINRDTFLFRAPADDFDRMEPIVSAIRMSIMFNLNWFEQEVERQIEQGILVLKDPEQEESIYKEIAYCKSKIYTEVSYAIFSTRIGLMDYINPFTDKTELGIDQWAFRWINKDGDVVYTDDIDYNPNLDPELGKDGFKQSVELLDVDSYFDYYFPF